MRGYKNILKLLESNQLPLLLFLSSFFILITFFTTRVFISDEGILVNQFYNLIHGSLSLQAIKIQAVGPHVLIDNHLYGKFSYSLVILSLPFYYMLRAVDNIYSAHLFIVQLWALSGGIVVYLLSKDRVKYPELVGAFSYFVLAAVNMSLFRPLYFPKWGELLAIEFTSILVSSLLIVFVYLLFRDVFSARTATFASLFVIFATPVSFYAVTLKLHSLSLLLTVMAFFFFYKYMGKKEDRYMYAAYAAGGLCVWTRVVDGIVLLASLLVMDIIVLRRGVKYAGTVFIIIIASLMPFFAINYLTLGSPFSVMELTPMLQEPVSVDTAPYHIGFTLETDGTAIEKFQERLGYDWTPEIKDDWLNVLLDITFLKVGNTFGMFPVSPFLIAALAFAMEGMRRKIRLNAMDIFLILYSVLLIAAHRSYFLTIIYNTPGILEYRYLLAMYIILLYFAVRVDAVRELIETRSKTIAVLYCIILTAGIAVFIKEYPLPFMSIYYYAALATAALLIVSLLSSLIVRKSSVAALTDNLIIFTAALSLALASFFLLFYYWDIDMTYVSPSQNIKIIPVVENLVRWMYLNVM